MITWSLNSYSGSFHIVAILIMIITVSFLIFDLHNTTINNNTNNKGKFAYAHIFSDTENAVTKNVDDLQ